MATIKYRSPLEFKDISGIEYRTYIFDNKEVIIKNPQWLNISESGGHRIIDGDGKCFYIPPKWLAIYWEVPEDREHFRF